MRRSLASVGLLGLALAGACRDPRSPVPSSSSSSAAEEGEVVWIRASAEEPEPGILKDLRIAGARVAPVGIAEAEQRTGEFGGGPIVVVAIGKAADEAIRIALSKDNHITRVVALNGTYALALVQRTNVDVLLFSDSEPAHAQAGRRVARSIGSKHAAHYVVTPSDGEAMKKLAIEFLRTGDQTLSIDSPLGVQQRWANLDPPVEDAEAFWRAPHVDRATTQPTTGRFQVALAKIFSDSMHLLAPYPLAKYTSIPLEATKGEHLIVTNIRGEQLYLTKRQIQLHQPVIVIGIDDEKNLYRLALGYRLDQERSWEKTARPPTMVRAVGPFLFFPNGDFEDDTTQAPFSLAPGSFQFVNEDPIAKARAIKSGDLRSALLGADGCLKCHGLHGMGAKAHHVRAIDGKAHGGFALALESYPNDVLDRFLFDQKKVAAGFGVTPLTIPEPTAKQILSYVKTAKE
jgi:hypothetical protein